MKKEKMGETPMMDVSGRGYNGMGRPNMIRPSGRRDYQILQAVDNRTSYDVASLYNFTVFAPWQCNTIACALVKTISAYLVELQVRYPDLYSKGNGFDYANLLRVTINNKVNASAEKQGNLNVSYEALNGVESIISEVTSAGKIVPLAIPPREEIPTFIQKYEIPQEDILYYQQIDEKATYLLTRDYGISIVNSKGTLVTSAIACRFLENMYAELVALLLNKIAEDGEDFGNTSKMVSVNFNELIEIHCGVKDGEIKFWLRPGQNAKKQVKSDERTEDTLEDVEDLPF